MYDVAEYSAGVDESVTPFIAGYFQAKGAPQQVKTYP
jgi:hypothetical protein